MPTTRTPHTVRRRRSNDVEAAVYEATERLLGRLPMKEVSVARIVEEAGITRTRFYYHFDSALAVLAGLLDQITDELVDPFERLRRESESTRDPGDVWAEFARNMAKIYRRHAPLMRAVLEQWHQLPQLTDTWLSFQAKAIDQLTQTIDHHRASGLALPGIDSRRLAQTIVWSSTSVGYMADRNSSDGGPGGSEGIADASEPLFAMVIATLYGRDAAAGLAS